MAGPLTATLMAIGRCSPLAYHRKRRANRSSSDLSVLEPRPPVTPGGRRWRCSVQARDGHEPDIGPLAGCDAEDPVGIGPTRRRPMPLPPHAARRPRDHFFGEWQPPSSVLEVHRGPDFDRFTGLVAWSGAALTGRGIRR